MIETTNTIPCFILTDCIIWLMYLIQNNFNYYNLNMQLQAPQ